MDPSSPRRKFLKKLGAGIATAAVSGSLPAENLFHFSLPLSTAFDGEEYWELVKAQFAVPTGKLMVNSANLCPSPFAVREQVQKLARDLEMDVSFQNRAKFSEFRQVALTLLAEHLGADKSEIAITRNTSESNNMVIQGLDLTEGDEVIIWDQNHPTNHIAWKQNAIRRGFKVVEIKTPSNPESAGEVVDPFVDAINDRTRVIAFSHISNVSGIALPAKEICKIARARNILTLVDGAQAFGFLDLDLHDLGCDFYTGSSHKWLMGPIETGILYVREGSMNEIFPHIIGAGWSTDHTTIDQKMAVLGQRNYSTISSLVAAIEFQRMIGQEKIEARIRQVNQYLKQNVTQRIPDAEFVTPLDPAMSGGITIVQIPGKDNRQIFERLYEEHGIAGAPTGGVRFSPNIDITLKDIDRIVDALIEVME